MEWMHNSNTGGHSGIKATLRRIKSLFHWPGMKKNVAHHIKHCLICQRCKYDQSASPGLLQPLAIPERVWEEVTMDFI